MITDNIAVQKFNKQFAYTKKNTKQKKEKTLKAVREKK